MTLEEKLIERADKDFQKIKMSFDNKNIG